MSDQTSMPTQTPPDLPPSPRPLTCKARHRSWQEPTVRFFWLSTIVLVSLALYMLVSRYLEWRGEARLFDRGISVQAKVFVPGVDRSGIRITFGDPVEVRFSLGGAEHKASGYLDDLGLKYSSGDSITIHVDPDDPARWTNRTQAAGLGARLIGFYTALLAAIGTLVATYVSRNHYRGLWCNGEVKESVVASHEQLALAPRSVRLRCHVTKGREVLVVRVCVPQTEVVPAVGEKTHLICDRDNWRDAIPLVAYQ